MIAFNVLSALCAAAPEPKMATARIHRLRYRLLLVGARLRRLSRKIVPRWAAPRSHLPQLWETCTPLTTRPDWAHASKRSVRLRRPRWATFADNDMKKSTTIYAALACLIQALIARGYQTISAVYGELYAHLFGENFLRPPLTQAAISHTWILYLPILVVGLGWRVALRRNQNNIAVHCTFWGMFIFLVTGAMHVLALFLPFVITIEKLK
jgi:hypothetical protein